MPTAEELLDRSVSTDSADIANRLLISEDLRTISVPSSQSVLGVVGDSNVRRVWFTMPAECDGTDLEPFTPFVNYVNVASNVNIWTIPDNISSRYQVTDAVKEGDAITFSWLVSRTAFTTEGLVYFNVDLKLFDTDEVTVIKEFNTTMASMTVLPNLPSGTYNAAEAYVDEITEALVQMVNRELDTRKAFSHKGSVATYAELPASDVLAGSVYNVTATGRNYVWTGTAWDDLGGVDALTVTSATDAQIDAMFA